MTKRSSIIDLTHDVGDEAFETAFKSLPSIRYNAPGHKELEEIILTFFSFNNESGVVLSKPQIKRLMQLGFSGSILAQRLFAKAMDKIVSFKVVQNTLFARSSDPDDSGAGLLKKLLWCAEFDDEETKLFASQALDKLTADTQGLNLSLQRFDGCLNNMMFRYSGLREQDESVGPRPGDLGGSSDIF